MNVSCIFDITNQEVKRSYISEGEERREERTADEQ
jgi:hypothetical protein